MPARLVIAEGEYALQQAVDGGWVQLTVLPGGPGALLPPTRAIDEGRLEAAIELAEDWLMPHAARLRGEVLEVDDPTGRFRSGMQEVLSVQAVEWSVAQLEGFFLLLVALATGRVPSAALRGRHAFAAGLLVLRELAHHGQVRGVRLAAARA